jgi:hypothetical protein
MKWYIRSEDGFRVVKKKKREKRSECILLLFLTSVG